jgi:hypothetical protein
MSNYVLKIWKKLLSIKQRKDNVNKGYDKDKKMQEHVDDSWSNT